MPTPSTGKKSKKTSKPKAKPKARAAAKATSGKQRNSQKVVTKVIIMGGGGSPGTNTTQLVDPYGALHGGHMGTHVVYQQPSAPVHQMPEHAVPVQPRAPQHHLPSKQGPHDVRNAVAGALLMTRAYMEGEKSVKREARVGTPAAPLKPKMDPTTLSPVPPPSPAATPSPSTSIRPSGRQYKRSEMLEMRKLQDSEGWLLAHSKRRP